MPVLFLSPDLAYTRAMNLTWKPSTAAAGMRRAKIGRAGAAVLSSRACAFLCAVVFSGAAMASTFYKCVDASGKVLFTNAKPEGKRHKCATLSYYSPPLVAADGGGRGKARSVTAATPADFPRVAGDEQKSRDSERRAILERELGIEQASLEKARQLLTAAPPQGAQEQRDTVALHERNIKALQKELGKPR